MSTGLWLGPQPARGPSVSALRPWELPALTAPDEPPIFSRSRKDNLERSWAGLAGGGPSFSHSWIAAGRKMVRNSETPPPNQYGHRHHCQAAGKRLHLGEAEGPPMEGSQGSLSVSSVNSREEWEVVTDRDLGSPPAERPA